MNAAAPREIAGLVPMPRLLAELGFQVGVRTRRGACLLHGGSNPSAFAWREDGHWHCFSCGAGGDKIALVRAACNCSFTQAVEFLAALAGVEYSPRRISRREAEARQRRRERADQAAWWTQDEIARLRRHYRDGLVRANHLCWQIGERLRRTAPGSPEREAGWDVLAKLAPISTFYVAVVDFLDHADTRTLVRFADSRPSTRRAMVLEGERETYELAA